MQPTQNNPNNWNFYPVADVDQNRNNGLSAALHSQPVQQYNWIQDAPTQTMPQTHQALSTSGYFVNEEIFSQTQQEPLSNIKETLVPSNIENPIDNPILQNAAVSYSRQNTQQMDKVQDACEFFDNRTGNNNDGWGDWDWNDNGFQQQQQQQKHIPISTCSMSDSLQADSNETAKCFQITPESSSQWGPVDRASKQGNNLVYEDLYENSQLPPPQLYSENHPSMVTGYTNLNTENLGIPSQQNVMISQSKAIEIQSIALKSSPTNDIPQSLEGSQNLNNIPSPVYVSQAKPVSKPPKQYASLPGVSSDIPNTFGLTRPPQAFQNPSEQASSLNAENSQNTLEQNGSAPKHLSSNVGTGPSSEKTTTLPFTFYSSPPPPPEDFANPSMENLEVINPENSEVLTENQEFTPNNDRNEYLQTSHLSEVGGNADNVLNIVMQEQNNESDVFPPPGLSRLVLGQPENEPHQISGTYIENMFSIERQADGEDTGTPIQRSTFASSLETQNNISSDQIDITGDRNLYLVPGESEVQEQRVVTGLENSLVQAPAPPVQVEQRELELDGENIEDEPQLPAMTNSQHLSHNHHRPVSPIKTNRTEPLEGANSLDRHARGNQHTNNETESSITAETNLRDLSNISTGNDESDHRDRHHGKIRRGDEGKKRRTGSKENRYESEESDFSTDKDRRRYREGSVRSERDRDRDIEERKRRDKRAKESRVDRDHYWGDDHDTRYRKKYYGDRDGKLERSGRYKGTLYDVDSKYENENSVRHDRRRTGDHSERSDRVEREAFAEYRKHQKYSAREERNLNDARSGARLDLERHHGDKEYVNDRSLRRHKDRREKQPRSDYEEYRKTSSRNARESDIEKESRQRDKDPRYAPHNVYSGYSGYGYDPYAAYYYEQMVRTNPQAYSEWYRKYYSQAIATETLTNDGRESVHSGRSSTNNDKDRRDHLSRNSFEATKTINQIDPQRLTPRKFTNEHPIISLGPGLMIAVKPKYSSNVISNVVKIYRVSINDATNKLFQSFPGPLARGSTHKKTIIEFCEDQIRSGSFSTPNSSRQNSLNNVSLSGKNNEPSYTLLWNLLILLITQNGVVVGTDIAELLIKNQLQFPYGAPVKSLDNLSNRRESLKMSEEQKSKEDSQSDLDPEFDNDESVDYPDGTSKNNSLTEEQITEKFRNYLLYGNVNEALDWATDNNLWGHALFLASKVDRRSHANVMMKFANKLSLNDPLQTLYQLMSGRSPSSVTSIQDENWGDWRPHLAMILSNTSNKPDLDRKAITTLGDSLFARDDLFAAHFCYLMAQVGFSKYPEEQTDGTVPQNSARLVLLGSSHLKTFEKFATNESIMMTEVYEYACSLNDEKFSLVEFQPYKFLLATRMLDYGHQLKCFMYMEQICAHIQRDQTKYEPSFIKQVYELADRLKYYDPVLEKSADEMETDFGHNQVNDFHFEEPNWLKELRHLTSESMVTMQTHVATQENNMSNVIDQQFSEINRQFDALNLQYNANAQEQQQNTAQVGTVNVQSNSLQDNRTQTLAINEPYPVLYDPKDAFPTAIPTTDGINYDNRYAEVHQPYDFQQPIMYEPQQQENSYEYWAPQAKSQEEENARPTISMPNTKPQKSSLYENSRPGDNLPSTANTNETSHSEPSAETKNKSNNQTKSGNNANQNSGWFGGIWNKLSLKPKNQMILPDDKNPAIVWDSDKKKWVNTDGAEESEENLKPPPKMADLRSTINSLPAPQQRQPQFDQISQQMEIQSSQPITGHETLQSYSTSSSAGFNSEEQAKPPSLQSNMFKMQRNRTLKNSYVDVFNPSGAPPRSTEQVLAPALPLSPVSVSGFLVPGANPAGDVSYKEQQQPAQEGAPQFYNPTQIGGYQQR